VFYKYALWETVIAHQASQERERIVSHLEVTVSDQCDHFGQECVSLIESEDLFHHESLISMKASI
jgi:hypothetical protein